MHGKVLELNVDDQAEEETEEADQEAPDEELLPGDGSMEEADPAKVGEDEIGLAALGGMPGHR